MIEVVRESASFPEWSDVKSFSWYDLMPGRDLVVAVRRGRGRLLVTSGGCQVRQDSRSQVLREQQFFALEAGEAVLAASGPAQAILFEGEWGDELGGCGVFRAENVATPTDRGDPMSYPKRTNVDAHYHDCQEFWLLLEGAATAVVSDQHIPMRPGDCLPIPMGAVHDMPDAPQTVKAVYFETTLRGQRRTGHLWQHTHGPAVQMEGK
jgi:mannose-6-phosphate isomerase-like protein (cupin superfamily)